MNKKDLHAQEINTITYGAKQISYITRQCWNELPKEIKQEQNTNTFRQNLKENIFYLHTKKNLLTAKCEAQT